MDERRPDEARRDDPWRDVPSPDAGGDPGGDAGAGDPGTGEPVGRTCPWCSAPAADDATTCAACGAALAQREALGGLVIPGLTAVDPGLEAYAAQPLRIPGPSPTQAHASGAVAAGLMGGPVGLAALGGLAAMAAAEYLGAGGGAGGTDGIGVPHELAVRMVEQLEEQERTGTPATGRETRASRDPNARDAADGERDGGDDREPGVSGPKV